MSKQRRRRSFDPGQFVSPMLNELEWLDEPPELNTAPVAKKKPAPQRRTSQMKPAGGNNGKARTRRDSQKTQPASVMPPIWHPGTYARPLMLLNKRSPQTPRSRWARELFGYDSWAAQKADQIVDAIQSFQLGLDGILKGGEMLNIIPASEYAKVIDITPDSEDFGKWEQPSAPVPDPAAEKDTAEDDTGRVKEQQLYGLIPYRIQPPGDCTDIAVTFEKPFVNDRYALVATTDQTGCHTVIREKKAESAVIRLIRDSDDRLAEGEINWIAIGDTEA